MKPTREQIIRILERCRYWREQDRKLQQLYEDFNAVFASSSYPPIIDYGSVDHYIEGVCEIIPELEDDLSYFVYEANEVKYNEKTYDASDIEQFADFILDSNNWND